MNVPSIVVSPWTVLMAVRYGMGRLTYANEDAAKLARQHWDTFDESAQRTVIADAERLTGFTRTAWEWLVPARQASHPYLMLRSDEDECATCGFPRARHIEEVDFTNAPPMGLIADLPVKPITVIEPGEEPTGE